MRLDAHDTGGYRDAGINLCHMGTVARMCETVNAGSLALVVAGDVESGRVNVADSCY